MINIFMVLYWFCVFSSFTHTYNLNYEALCACLCICCAVCEPSGCSGFEDPAESGSQNVVEHLVRSRQTEPLLLLPLHPLHQSCCSVIPSRRKRQSRRKGGVALQQHISCKFMQNSKSAAAAGSAAAAAVLHTARTRTAPAGCTGPTRPRTRFAAGSRLQEEAERPGPVTVSTDRDLPPLSSGERARQQQRLAGC